MVKLLQRDRTNPRNHIELLAPKDAKSIVAKLKRQRHQKLPPWATFEVRRYVGDGD